MVANTALLHIHQRLKEIFGTTNSKLFAGLSIIVVGDLNQLPQFVENLYLKTIKMMLSTCVTLGMYLK